MNLIYTLANMRFLMISKLVCTFFVFTTAKLSATFLKLTIKVFFGKNSKAENH